MDDEAHVGQALAAPGVPKEGRQEDDVPKAPAVERRPAAEALGAQQVKQEPQAGEEGPEHEVRGTQARLPPRKSISKKSFNKSFQMSYLNISIKSY